MVISVVAIAFFGSLAYIAGKLIDKGNTDELVILLFFGFVFGTLMMLGISGVIK